MWKVVMTVVLSAAVLYGAYTIMKNRAYRSGFATITKGMTRSQVIDVMGKPDVERGGCRDQPSWLGEPSNDHLCSTEFQYNSRISPEFWTVGFGTNGEAIAKYHYVSP